MKSSSRSYQQQARAESTRDKRELILNAGGAAAVRPEDAQRGDGEVVVGIDEAGQHGAAAEVDELVVALAQPEDLVRPAHLDHAPVADGEGFRHGLGRVHRQHARVDDEPDHGDIDYTYEATLTLTGNTIHSQHKYLTSVVNKKVTTPVDCGVICVGGPEPSVGVW